ncbi:MAG: aldo/keto reductase [Sedimenticola sp.]|nr:aldo/keto reductase [Sedimenticola sp.]
MIDKNLISRRQFIYLSSYLAAGLVLPIETFAADQQIYKTIPKSGEQLPVIGMGTSRTFEARNDPALLAQLQQVMQTFFDLGGGMIDSSPMYGSAQQIIGTILPNINGDKKLFAATKVWIDGQQAGIEQMEKSRQQWGIKQFDLMQIHNLVDWQNHLETLNQMKADGKIRYTGITTSHGRSHNQLEHILKQHDFDFLQLTYNIGDREVESNLLPLAQERGIAVIINRPYQRGSLFRQVKGKALPEWAREFDCSSWGQYFLKFAVSHPAVTCAIPATTKAKHMIDNMQAGKGRLPTEAERKKMISYFSTL